MACRQCRGEERSGPRRLGAGPSGGRGSAPCAATGVAAFTIAPTPAEARAGARAPSRRRASSSWTTRAAIRTICRVNLESDGLTVVEATDGREAIDAVRVEQPELVLLDVMMPELDGWQVAEQLLADQATRDIPVVFLSARAAREDKARAQELGAVGDS